MPACGMDTARSRAICGSSPMLANSVVPIAKAPSDMARITNRRRPGDSGAVGVEECEVTEAPARGTGRGTLPTLEAERTDQTYRRGPGGGQGGGGIFPRGGQPRVGGGAPARGRREGR